MKKNWTIIAYFVILVLILLVLFVSEASATPPGHLSKCLTNPHFNQCAFLPMVIK